MDAQTLFNVMVGVLGPICLFLLRTTHAKIEAMQSELSAHKLHVSEHYAKSAAVESLEEKIMEKLDKVLEKLDQKADK